MSAGGTPAVLFYLLDRYALLAMTVESKRINANPLPSPPPVVQSTTPPAKGGGHSLAHSLPCHSRLRGNDRVWGVRACS